MADLRDFLDYPVVLTSEEMGSLTHNFAQNEIPSERVEELFHGSNSTVYELVIYKNKNRKLMDRIINNNLLLLEKPIKRAIMAQVNYNLDAGGDIGSWSGIVRKMDGSTEIQSAGMIKDKMVAPKVYEILSSCVPKLYFGETPKQEVNNVTVQPQ